MSILERVRATKDKLLFTTKMLRDGEFREEWLMAHLERDKASGTITEEEAIKIENQAKSPKGKRHLIESLVGIIGPYAVVGGAMVPTAGAALYQAIENGDLSLLLGIAGYTAYQFSPALKFSASSILRTGCLGVGIIYDHCEDKSWGSKKQLLTEAAALGTSFISYYGAGNGGYIIRMGIHSPDLAPYLGKILLHSTRKSKSLTTEEQDSPIKKKSNRPESYDWAWAWAVGRGMQ